MLFGLPPSERGLEAGVSAAGVKYWEFSPDYGQRLWTIMQRLGEQAARKPTDASPVKP
jgi:hypothetical protein